MKRDFLKHLLYWKQQTYPIPLIVRGARQVGKTYIIEHLGHQYFESFVGLNFEINPQYCNCFLDLDPISILQQIELIAKKPIVPGKTLLFLDEIQQCPKALQSLRYFKERLPELHVIAAGSLLEFAIREEDFSFPVGRVQFATLYPLSFAEYLDARGDTLLRESLTKWTVQNPPPEAIHNHLNTIVQEYFMVGGMPAAADKFFMTRSLLEAKYIQKSLWDAFEADFGKYAKQTQHRHLKKIFEQMPRLIGEHIKYSRIDPELPNAARSIKQALELLTFARLLHIIYATSGGSLPFLANIKEGLFKLIFLDIGMVAQTMDLEPNSLGLMAGPLAEQFVGQELLAQADPVLESQLLFWSREGSSAEVDYLISHKGTIYPVEVKAGKGGKLKSLQIFITEKKSPIGIKVSQDPLRLEKNILSVPFYLTAHLPRLL